ncbi:hypothetical protein [Chromobacterium alticapitis]|uniref:Uncharacterized protein n=1 Tax=Chromobacterium alticapitis TaxID=2073169 RepID=A0A2S5DJX0_9NEIS|nr:hypothetical protein [Chromobacterium alticapitis]POZ63337.1 hypothetical protein C2I19_03765 [Chromobacterium alticapitis]
MALVLDRDKVGITANVASSTDCDSNLSWILPVVGDMFIHKVDGVIDATLKSKVADSLANFKDALLFKPDQNWLVGLNQLVPVDKIVNLPGGGNFPIGQYVRNNTQYLIGNSQITLRLGDWLPPFQSDPSTNGKVDVSAPQNYSSEVLSLTLTSPASSFSIKVNEVANVGWKWDGTLCGSRNSRMTCVEP